MTRRRGDTPPEPFDALDTGRDHITTPHMKQPRQGPTGGAAAYPSLTRRPEGHFMPTSIISEHPRSVSQRTHDLFEADDPTAINIWWIGYRAGTDAERARVQLLAADFGADLGPSPVLQPRLRVVPDQGSPEAGKAVRDAAVAAWRQLYASGQIVAEVAA